MAGSQVSSLLHPVLADQLPTYHRLNKFTRAFQVINDAYGVAWYKEVNPGKKILGTACKNDLYTEHLSDILFVVFSCSDVNCIGTSTIIFHQFDVSY